MARSAPPTIPLPKYWTKRVRSALLQVVALARYASAARHGRVACSADRSQHLAAETQRLWQEVALLREELRIKDTRMRRIDAQRRPHYPPTQRMAILELRAACGWSQRQTAEVFQLTAATIASWMQRLDEQGPAALVQLRQPVNRFPDFVRYAVQRLKVLCPNLGKVKIAEILCRAGLHLAPATVGRILREDPQPPPKPRAARHDRVVTARRPNQVWHVDLTSIPTGAGFWVPWLPFALPDGWPFCWWVAVALDHSSRHVIGFAVFRRKPSSQAIRAFLGRTIATQEPPRNTSSATRGRSSGAATSKPGRNNARSACATAPSVSTAVLRSSSDSSAR